MSMLYIIIKYHDIYYLKNMETRQMYNLSQVEDLRIIRDIINLYHEELVPYQIREQKILDILLNHETALDEDKVED